jgi:hypothetical protein
MKTSKSVLVKVLFSTLMVCAAAMVANAQENSPLNPENDRPAPSSQGNQEDPILLEAKEMGRDGEAKTEAIRSDRERSDATKSAPKAAKPEAADNNSTLSFNFIYYFLQKFKFSE